MSWFAAFLWLLTGLVGGAFGIVYLVSWTIYHSPIQRLEFLRIFARRWPEDFERALSDMQLVGVSKDAFGFDYTLEPIQFGLCPHCQLPWPIDGGKLIQHPSINVRPYTGGTLASCKGSNSKDYHVSE